MLVTIILDGVGIGEAPDAALYGDEGSHTLGHVCETARPDLPHLTRLGLGNLADLTGIPPVDNPAADHGIMEETAAGKDSTSGHWELAGVLLDRPFPTYPHGFPEDVIRQFIQETGCKGVLANKPASGTVVIADYGEEHLATGFPIVYTSADSVFQIAAHTDVTPLDTLYEWCRVARERICVGDHAVGRVIARPFHGSPGEFERISQARKDFALEPPGLTIQQHLRDNDVRTIAVGKIGDLFANVGFDEIRKTDSNADGIAKTLEAIREADHNTFIWTNLVDFDQLFGHRNDPDGFARALEEFDRSIPDFEAALPPGGRLIITADHGNDPCFPGTDHTREDVPVLVIGGVSGRNLGTRKTFADHAASVAAHFQTPYEGPGRSFI